MAKEAQKFSDMGSTGIFFAGLNKSHLITLD